MTLGHSMTNLIDPTYFNDRKFASPWVTFKLVVPNGSLFFQAHFSPPIFNLIDLALITADVK